MRAVAPGADELAGRADDPLAALRTGVEGGAGLPVVGEAVRFVVGDPDIVEADALAALAVVVARYSGRSAVQIGRDADASVDVETDSDSTVAEYRARVRALLSGAGDRHEDGRGHKPGPAGVGVVVRRGAELFNAAPQGSPPFALTLCVETDRGHGRLRLLSSDIPDALLRSLSDGLANIHRQVTAPNGQSLPIRAVALLTVEEEHRVADLGRTARAAESTAGVIPEAFAEQLRRNPEAIALTCRGRSISYRELSDRAERIACGLRALGVEPGARVGILLDRSPELVVALLATMQAGAVYVPMEPTTPAARLAFVAADADLAVVITERDAAEAVQNCRTASPDSLVAAGVGTAPPTVRLEPADPAYVIYTSGSTGQPKGVVVPHGNVLALVSGTRADLAFGSGDTWAWFHSAAFDFSVWEVWGPLLTGGRVVVVPESARRNPEEFRQLLCDESVTVLNQTPSSFGQLLEVELRSTDRLALRLVVFGGEPLDAQTLLPWFDRYPEAVCRMVNMFGITETTVHVTAQTVTRSLAQAGSRSVGRAIPGWAVRVVDEQRRTLPPGAVGEIAVGGDGLALRYLNRPELTAERFIEDPVTGQRWYLSGDLGRLLPDGAVEHLGRIDGQVKLRGYRIELGEIRGVLTRDPRVRAAAVVLNRGPRDDGMSARLDAYVILSPSVAVAETADIRLRTADSLPSYMLPSTVTALAALPLTPNGKLDLAALPAPEPDSAGADTWAPALTERQSLLLAVWGTELCRPVGLDDSFFDLGGNSLLAGRLVRVLRDRGLSGLALRDLYLHPTARKLDSMLEEKNSNRPEGA